jgi:hypothetical protein
MTEPRTIAALCVSRRSVYHSMPGVEAFDTDRDARTFAGGMPVVAHPPCRSWSAFTSHQAKPLPGERELGLWCVDQVRQWGGVLEQPAHSQLWAAAGLPSPGDLTQEDSWSLEVWQAWWGYPMKKGTWLYFSGVDPSEVDCPLKLHPKGGDRRREQVMSKTERSHTTPAFAEWLVALARKSVLRGELEQPTGAK